MSRKCDVCEKSFSSLLAEMQIGNMKKLMCKNCFITSGFRVLFRIRHKDLSGWQDKELIK
jgi:DNA-directed RNA polymerase subunit RPC12/RpoP